MSTPLAPAAAPPAAPRRHFLTMLFADLCQSTRIGSTLEAEHFAALIGALQQLYAQAVRAHGGEVIRSQGDGVLAIFGYPDPSEDDGSHATDAALELHAAVRALVLDASIPLPVPLRLHTGIHAGLVLVSEGDIVRGRIDLMGHAPNVAAKLAAAAGEDEILVSEATLGPQAHRFTVAARRAIKPSGSLPAMTALQVTGLAAQGGSGARLLQPALEGFVGRPAEMTLLAEGLDAVRRGRARQIALVGPAGVGKSRLAQAFLEQCAAQGCDVLRGSCNATTFGHPLEPFQQMLATRLDLDLGADAGTLRTQLHTALEALDAPDRRFGLRADEALWARLLDLDEGELPLAELARALARLLHALREHAPVVMLVDDWHRADDASHQVLATVLSDAHATPVPFLLLLTARRLDSGDGGLRDGLLALALPPLEEPEASAVVRGLLPEADPFLVAEITRHSGGNPLYIEELCHRVAREGRLPAMSTSTESGAWLDLLIESRVSRLPETQAALVRSAAVLGATVPVWLFEEVTGVMGDSPAVRALADEDLVFAGEQPGTLRFKHEIAREVIYRSVGLQQRRALHQAAAKALLARCTTPVAAEEWSESLAYHCAAGGDALRAADFAALAARRALRAPALDRAQSHFRAALAALDALPASPDLARRWNQAAQGLAFACVFDPSRSDLPFFERAVEFAQGTGDPKLLARALHWQAYVTYALGNQRQALPLLQRTLAAAQDAGDEPLRVQALATLGQSLVAAGRNREAEAPLYESIALKQQHHGGPVVDVGLAYALAIDAHRLGDLGRFEAAQARFEEAYALVGDTPNVVLASIHALHAAVLLWQGRWEDARAAATRAYRTGQQVRSLLTLTMGRAMVAYADWMLKRRATAIEAMRETASWLLPRGNLLFRSLLHGWLADAYACAGQPREAYAQAVQALRREHEFDGLGAPMACRAMARIAAGDARLDAARHWLARARVVAQRRNSAHEQAANDACAAELDALTPR